MTDVTFDAGPEPGTDVTFDVGTVPGTDVTLEVGPVEGTDVTLDVGPVEGTSVAFDVETVPGTDVTFDIGATPGGGGGVTLPIDISDVTGLTAAIAAKEATGVAAALVDDLSGVTNAAAARTNLGLGTAATEASSSFQPVDSDLTAIAALSTTSFGRGLLALADAAAGRTALGLGSLATASTVASSDITDGTIVNADINASAAIALSKLATDPLARANHTGTQLLATISDAGTLAGLSAIASAQITDGTIVDADINASAAIAQSKIASLTTDLAAKAATSALTYPRRVSVACSVSPPNTYTTWTPTLSAVTYNGYSAGAVTASSETWTFILLMDSGTWSLRWVYRSRSAGGIITPALAGTSLTTVDTYAASNAESTVTQTGITVASAGHQSFVLTNPTRHASSSGYGFIIHGFEFWRTGA